MGILMRVAAGSALIGLAFSGCAGKENAAKPDGPGTVSVVSWGEAVNGLQAGLGRSVMAGRTVCSDACKAKLVSRAFRPSESATCPACREKRPLGADGICGICSRRAGTCEVCSAPLSGPVRSSGERPVDLELWLRISGEKAVKVTDLDPEIGWSVRFVAMDPGGISRLAARLTGKAGAGADGPVRNWPPVNLRTQQLVPFWADGKWYFPAIDAKAAEPAKTLPLGRYTVTATYRHAPCPPDRSCPYWHGQVSTGPVEMEVGSKAVTPAVPRPVAPEMPKPIVPETPKPVTPESPKPVVPETSKPVVPETPRPVVLTEEQVVEKARVIGRKRWPEQVKNWPAGQPLAVLDGQPTVEKDGENWKVTFQLGNPDEAGARVTVALDVAGREISTKCEWSPL